MKVWKSLICHQFCTCFRKPHWKKPRSHLVDHVTWKRQRFLLQRKISISKQVDFFHILWPSQWETFILVGDIYFREIFISERSSFSVRDFHFRAYVHFFESFFLFKSFYVFQKDIFIFKEISMYQREISASEIILKYLKEIFV